MARNSKARLDYPTPAASYFKRDAGAIAAANRAAPCGRVVVGAGLVALLSIRMPWRRVSTMFRAVIDSPNSRESRGALFGAKREGYAYLLEHRRALWQACEAYHANPDKRRALEALLVEFLEIPNLGIVKASFLAQMLVNDGACLDMHNLDRMGLDRNAFATPKGLSVETLLTKIRTYNAAWRVHGDSALWWDTWCEYYAAVNPDLFFRASDVSAAHTVALTWTQERANAPAHKRRGKGKG